ncbi:MAG: glycoside hydrolase [Crocinitomicaceae bacterium]|nr:glycoside hydrolase [Crocinitomicaceae bacterium]
MKNLLGVFLLVLSNNLSAQDSIKAKINGLSMVSQRFILDSVHVLPVVEVGANYAAVIPYCFMPKKDSSVVYFGDNNQWQGEGPSGTRIAVRELHSQGVKTMIKPQIWVGHGIFTGEIEMKSEVDWSNFEKNYAAYILAFAKIAEEEGSAMLCIGTEMMLVVKNRPEIFTRLIKQVREVYEGEVTYAENWDCFEKVQFWDALDYIGVDAYFPISTSRNPSVKKLDKGWANYLPMFDSLSTAFGKKILFTEYGYRSIKKCVATPWKYDRLKGQKIDERCQVKALTSLYKNVWDKDYFAGGFLWKWHPKDEIAGGENNSMFTVQNKLAEETVRMQYIK